MNKYVFFLFILIIGIQADEVRLSDGSVLKGKIAKIQNDKLTLISETLGKLTVKMNKVHAYKTDEAVSFRSDGGQTKKAIYDSENNEAVKTLWSGDQDPDIFVNRWSRILYLNMVRKTGNKDEENFDGGIELKYIREFDTFKAYAEFEQDKRNDRKSSDEYRWGLDYELRFGEQLHHSWYIRADWEKDRLKDIDLRSTYASGYGYYFIKEPKTLLRGRAGLLYRTEEFYEDDSNESVGIDFGMNFEKTFYEDIAWYTNVTYAPAFEDFADYKLDHESGITIPLDIEIDLSLKTGIRHEYDSKPAEDTKKLDTIYFMRLQLEF